MCQFKSFIVTKDKILYSLQDESHTAILEENNINDESDSPEFVRVELVPKDNIFNLDLTTWELSIDQDFKPDWFFKEIEEPKIRKIMEDVIIPEQIFINKKNVVIKDKKVFCKNSSVTARGNSSVVARENSSVTARENSSVEAYKNSSVIAWGNSSVTAWGNSSVEAWGNSSVEAWENSSVVARENSSVVIPFSDGVIIKKICDNAIIKDLSSSVPKLILAKDNKFKIENR